MRDDYVEIIRSLYRALSFVCEENDVDDRFVLDGMAEELGSGKYELFLESIGDLT